MDKFTIFRELLDYAAHITKVTDADMNAYGYKDGALKIIGETEDQVITFEVTFEKKEEENDGN